MTINIKSLFKEGKIPTNTEEMQDLIEKCKGISDEDERKEIISYLRKEKPVNERDAAMYASNILRKHYKIE